ncbi:hypothetical protein FV102_08865 [Campylobacter jejuni]|uniref:Uncharacterized protein n=6 Tax=Campylobacter TaxID=194 RepID=A0A5Y8XIM7_CAMJU|nr:MULTISPECIES: hypothetical protein [Campylobacter]EAH5734195.1 hypothetical protein [Campylobacter jejuni]EAH7636774.1 hypothetical protein [Campylobacter jejuni]EAH7640125.1 hypothetical protein [Campylobacter jejuni]EAH9301141.1 hypothetical protein [Campylobacter jejuni]EAH9407134.1 hypothetical protein [Campylobacter coli]
MTREQAELIIKEEKLIYITWRDYDNTAGEYHFTIWFNPNNNKYEAVYIGERGGVELEYSFDSEKEAIDKMLQMNYKQKYFSVNEDYSMQNRKEVALRIIQEENLEVIWYDEALKPLCAGIKHDKQRDKYISFITNAKAEIIEWKSIEFDGDEEFEGKIYNDESKALYALINRARMIKQNRISFV